MRTSFPGHCRPTREDFAQLWKNCVFVFDASVLLNLYCYSDATRTAFLEILEALKERCWIPHQFALEYVENRAGIIVKQVQDYQKVERAFKQAQSDHFQPSRRHPFISAGAVEAIESLQKELRAGRQTMQRLLVDDEIRDALERIFEERVGQRPGNDEIPELHKVAQDRLDGEIPPGYSDLKEKGIPGAYGDFVGWHQTISFAKKRCCAVVLVTDDAKPDWWHIVQIESRKNTIGPRPELRREFLEAVGSQYYQYSSDQFMQLARVHLEREVAESAINEMRELVEERFRTVEEKASREKFMPQETHPQKSITVDLDEEKSSSAHIENEPEKSYSTPSEDDKKEDGESCQ
jgi:hypothetical protein